MSDLVGGSSGGCAAAPGPVEAPARLHEDGACYAAGTRIATDRGAVPIEFLAIGDLVVTLSGARRPVKWVGRRSYGGRFLAANRQLLPVLLRAGALDDGIPARDLMVSPTHAMLSDGVLVAAELLVNGTTIVRVGAIDQITYLHVELDSHDILLAEDAPSESFAARGNRGMFHNAAEFADLYPAEAARIVACCAPRIEGGAVLEVIRQRLAVRAAGEGGTAGAPGPLEGHIDAATPGAISGWAFDPTRPGTPVQLQVLVDGTMVAELSAGTFRADLAEAGLGGGSCAFLHRMGVTLSTDRDHLLTVRRASDHAELFGSPFRLAARPSDSVALEGCIDDCDRVEIAGWAFDEAAANVPVVLEILSDGRVIGEVTADVYREDLAEAGKGQGACSFRYRFKRKLSSAREHVIQLRRAGDQVLVAEKWLSAPASSRRRA